MRSLARFVVRRPWLALATVVVLAAVGGFGVAASGLLPIRASSGHWAATEWFLHFTMRRSVVTHALMAPAPPDDVDANHMVMRGAGHFETGCRPCHGAPGDPLPPIPHAMTPHPPELGPRMASWRPRELFYIVKHGVKFTGMPAWPAQQRDDEVWAMVGFLRRLPQLTAADYEDLVRGGDSSLAELAGATSGVTAPDVVVEVCARCHGLTGDGRGVGAFPKLAGQQLEYMTRAMHAYGDGRRFSGIMAPLASGLQEDARHAALRYYASLPVRASGDSSMSPSAARGQAIATRGVPEQDIPVCAECHARRAKEAYPRLSGQYREYLGQQLRLLQQRQRGGSEFIPLMHSFVDRLTPQQIDDVAAYFAAAATVR
ncbi:MAG TPA: c-type cytochrome [Vicinamibacterales bacterium]|nr:c-type cytochrome [Vicinamibacterales bacterium]